MVYFSVYSDVVSKHFESARGDSRPQNRIITAGEYATLMMYDWSRLFICCLHTTDVKCVCIQNQSVCIYAK